MYKTEILSPDSGGIARACAAVAGGELVAMPTETVYGLAGHGLQDDALAKIFAAKERPTFDPLILHIQEDICRGGSAALSEACLIDHAALNASQARVIDALMRAFWPGPLTLVLPKHNAVPDLATSGLERVGLRVPAHPVAQALLKAVGGPLAAPSANRFGRISPTSAQHVLAELEGRIPFVLDGGPCRVGVESTVLAVEEERLVLLRPGGISSEEIEAATGTAPVGISRTEPSERAPAVSPGSTLSHYAPKTPLFLLPSHKPVWSLELLAPFASPQVLGAKVGVLAFSGDENEIRNCLKQEGIEASVEVLSRSGDVSEAARRLFHCLRDLDGGNSQCIVAEPCPSKEGLGHAIQDRLRRASKN